MIASMRQRERGKNTPEVLSPPSLYAVSVIVNCDCVSVCVCVCVFVRERERERENFGCVFFSLFFCLSHTCFHLLSLRLQVTHFDEMNFTKVILYLDHLNE